MGLSIERDYGPITLTDVLDKNGDPAEIDGAAVFVATSGGTIVTASGDTRTLPDGSLAFPDGSQYFSPAGGVGTIVHIDANVDVNLNKDITDVKTVATYDDVLVGGEAAKGTLNLGAGVPKP